MLTKLAAQNLLGWDVTGDIGGYTAYNSSRDKIVVFDRAPPLNPPTPAQERQRDLFRLAAEWWRSCPADYRAAVQHMAAACGCRYTGYNIAVCVALTGCFSAWETLCRQSGLDMEPPPFLGGT